jgi:hypothetical protein
MESDDSRVDSWSTDVPPLTTLNLRSSMPTDVLKGSGDGAAMFTDTHTLQQSRATINPYRYGVATILHRAMWDLQPAAWRSRRRLRSWKDRHRGEKAVILCNGPSLLKSDLSLLEGVFTFGLNKINLLFARSDLRPSCIVCVNPYVVEQNAGFFNETQIPLFLDRVARQHVRSRSNVAFLHSTSQAKFARDCSISINQGSTVTFVAMQLAFHMGFEKVALIGCDHNFSTKGPPNKVVTAGERDADHFDPTYFSGGVRWQLPDLARSEWHYVLARDTFEAFGRKIVNATEGGELEVFQRTGLKSFIES